MSVTGEEGRPPVRVGPSIVDQGTGMWAVIGILAALHRRALTGEGCVVGTSLYETALGWTAMHTAQLPRLRARCRAASARRISASRPTRPSKRPTAGSGDRGRQRQSLFARLAAGARPSGLGGRSALSAPIPIACATASAEHADRRHHQDRADAMPGSRKLDAAGVPCAPMLALDEVLGASAMRRRSACCSPRPTASTPLMGLPLQFDGERPPFRRAPPALGEGTGHCAQGCARWERGRMNIACQICKT